MDLSYVDYHSLPIGYDLHWYTLKAVIGSGGFGITYLATDNNLHRPVAIKEFFPSDLAARRDDSKVQPSSATNADTYAWGLSRFIHEAQTLAKFKHPNIVRIYSVFDANDTAYMVMEYHRGEHLNDAIKSKRLTDETRLLSILHDLLSGLQAVHDAGVIHRDVKPENIILRDDGRPVLLDFGSARHNVAGKTRALTSIVSPGYAPIEQYSDVDTGERQGPWTDIYSLAATMYTAVTGLGPISATTRAAAIVNGEPDPLVPVSKAYAGRWSTQFLTAIDQALSMRPNQRPQSVEQWRAMLPPVSGEATRLTGDIPGRRNRTESPSENVQDSSGHRIDTAAAPPRGRGKSPKNTTLLSPPSETRSTPSGFWPQPGFFLFVALGALVVAGGYWFIGQEDPGLVIEAHGGDPTHDLQEENSAPPREQAPSPGDLTNALLKRANDEYESEDFASAARLYKEVLAHEPDNPAASVAIEQVSTALLQLAARAIADGNLTEAHEQIDLAATLTPTSERLENTRERLAAARQQEERKLADAEAREKRIAILRERGRAAIQGERPGEAIRAFRELLTLEPDDHLANQELELLSSQFLQRARIAIQEQRFQEARQHLAQARDLARTLDTVVVLEQDLAAAEAKDREHKKRLETLFGKATRALNNGELRTAASAYEEVLLLAPDHKEALSGLEAVAGRYAEAAKRLLSRKEFDQAGNHVFSALRITRNETTRTALESLEKRVKAAHAKHDETTRRLAEIDRLLASADEHFRNGRLTTPAGSNALDGYRQALARDPGNPIAEEGLRRIATQLKIAAKLKASEEKFDEALALIEAGLEVTPGEKELVELGTKFQSEREDWRAQKAVDQISQFDDMLVRRPEDFLTSQVAQLREIARGYERVLELDPGNQAAVKGLQKLAEQHAELAEEARLYFLDEIARQLIDAGLKLDRHNASLLELRRRSDSLLKKDLSQLEADAERQIAEGRFLEPDRDNALLSLKTILRKDPDNAYARRQLAQMAEHFLQRAREKLIEGDVRGGVANVEIGLIIDPAHAALLALKDAADR